MGTGIVIAGNRIAVAGLDVVNWIDEPGLGLVRGTDFRKRRPGQFARLIVLHAGHSGPDNPYMQEIRPGFGLGGDADERRGRRWTGSGRGAGAHLVVDLDGTIACTCDLATDAAFHCDDHMDELSVGVEIVQGEKHGELYEGQLATAVSLVDAVTRLMPVPIQRQIPHRYLGALRRFMFDPERPDRQPGMDSVGVIGHRDAAWGGGRFDPGAAVMNRLGLAGYEPVDYDQPHASEEDRTGDRSLWSTRQRQLGMTGCDGVPGPRTVLRLKAEGHPHGLWVHRPGDDQ